jgi:hypothetical protein
MFLNGLEGEFATTKKVLAAIPESQLDFKLGDKGRTARELAWHLAASEAWFANGAANADYNNPEAPMPPNATVADIVAYYEKEVPGLLAKIRLGEGSAILRRHEPAERHVPRLYDQPQRPSSRAVERLPASHERACPQHLWRQRG